MARSLPRPKETRVPGDDEMRIVGKAAAFGRQLQNTRNLHTAAARAQHADKLASKAVDDWIEGLIATAPLLSPAQRGKIAAALGSFASVPPRAETA